MADTLVIGLGNPLLGDDGAGIRAAEQVREVVTDDRVVVKDAAVGGLRFLEMITGYERVIVVDSIQTDAGDVGRIHRLEVGDGVSSKNICCAHDVGFFDAIALGYRLGLPMPGQISIYAIEVGECTEFTEERSPAVEATLMMTPPPRSFITGAAYLIPNHGPIRLTPSVWSHSAIVS